MIHIVVFGYVFVLLNGIICLTIALFLYLKIRNKLLFNFLIYFSAFTLFVFSYLVVLTYINVNLAEVSFYISLSVLIVISFSYSFLIFSILHFAHFLVYEKSYTKRFVFEILIGISSLIGVTSTFNVLWNKEQIYILNNFAVSFTIVLFFIVLGYSLVLKLIHLKIIDDERKRITKKTIILNIIFFPGFALDFYLIESGNFSLFIPLFYLCSSLLFLHYFIKKHNADLTTIKAISNQQAYSDYFMQHGISKREKEIVMLILKGYSNRKIANQLFISISTVKTHIRNIFQKLNVESRFEIISKLKNAQQSTF